MDAFVGEIRAVAFNFTPNGWLSCSGQLLPIQQYTVLFAVIGNSFGGDGRSTFALPNLAGRVISHRGQGANTAMRSFGVTYGNVQVTLLPQEIASHNHPALAALGNPAAENSAPGATEYLGHTTFSSNSLTYVPATAATTPFAAQAIGVKGGNGGHENRQPYLVLNYIICVEGLFPSRSR